MPQFLETKVKIVFRSAVVEINRFASDFNWQIHMADRIISTVLGEEKNYCLLRAFSTQLVPTTFKYISFCALHYSIIKSNSG